MTMDEIVIMDTSAGVGTAIRERRLELGLTQGEVAARIGVQASLISRIENGNRAINLRYANKLAGVLGWKVVRKVIMESGSP